MGDMYRVMSPAPDELPVPCPCCGSGVRVWELVPKDGPVTRVVMCENVGGIGPRDAMMHGGCLLHMPPDDFYHGTGRDAVRYWNDYAKALLAVRDRLPPNIPFSRNMTDHELARSAELAYPSAPPLLAEIIRRLGR